MQQFVGNAHYENVLHVEFNFCAKVTYLLQRVNLFLFYFKEKERENKEKERSDICWVSPQTPRWKPGARAASKLHMFSHQSLGE